MYNKNLYFMKKEKEKATDEIVIRSLSDAQAVRTRPGMYVGGVENPDLILEKLLMGLSMNLMPLDVIVY